LTIFSCEENREDGQCYETDPMGKRKARMTNLGGSGGSYEAVALDDRDTLNLRFFVTHDNTYGEFRRYTPHKRAVRRAMRHENYWDILHSPDGTMEYLVVNPSTENEFQGTYNWTKDITEGKNSAARYFRKAEGLEIDGNLLYFVASKQKEIFILNLDDNTYSKIYTFSPNFDGQPDGLRMSSNVLYVTEEAKHGNTAGIFGYDKDNGKLYSIFKSVKWYGDTTGVAFDPTNSRMYFAIQTDGIIFELRRKDGKPFDGDIMGVKYNAEASKFVR